MQFNPLSRPVPTIRSRLRAAVQRSWGFVRHQCAPAIRAGLTAAAISVLRMVIGRFRSKR